MIADSVLQVRLVDEFHRVELPVNILQKTSLRLLIAMWDRPASFDILEQTSFLSIIDSMENSPY